MSKIFTLALLCWGGLSSLWAQADSVKTRKKYEHLDSTFIHQVENHRETDKVLHAEPLLLGLICDLGAHKGEQELSAGGLMVDKRDHNEYRIAVEYEFAPVERLGLKVELPISFYFHSDPNATQQGLDTIPQHKFNGLVLGGQYSVWVSKKLKMSAALGYMHEINLTDFGSYSTSALIQGSACNAYGVVAKRWGHNWHTLIRGGFMGDRHFHTHHFESHWYLDANIHYMIEGTRNFIGVEVHKEFDNEDFRMNIYPQMRIGLADDFIVGIAVGIPFSKDHERLSGFFRLTYEPWHSHHHPTCVEQF